MLGIDASMSWAVWTIFGIVLLIGELVTPGVFVMLFFGIAALLVALFAAIGAAPYLWMQCVLFALFCIVSLAFFRRPVLRLLRNNSPNQKERLDYLVGERAVAHEVMPPGDDGKVEVRGSTWEARNVGSTLINKGSKVIVKAVKGLTLEVATEN